MDRAQDVMALNTGCHAFQERTSFVLCGELIAGGGEAGAKAYSCSEAYDLPSLAPCAP